MTPTPAQLALLRSSLPPRRVAPSLQNAGKPLFATLLQNAAIHAPFTPATAPARPGQPSPLLAAAHDARVFDASSATVTGGPAPVARSEILRNAQQFLNVPYVWGGTSPSGLDCSAFVSRAWGVSRQTTDTLSSVARPIGKEDLRPGDALNLITARDADGAGHVRLFDRWANAEHTKMWVYEETPPRSVHHVIDWDPAYQPMRRLNVVDA